MKTKILLFLLSWMLILAGCGNDEPARSQAQETQVQSGKLAAPAAQPNEPVFNRQQVLKDYHQVPLQVLDISERHRDGRNAIAITLSVPLDPSLDHQQYVNISRERHGVVDGAWVLSASGKTLWFPYVDPKVAYDVTVYQGLEAANGKRLTETSRARITTSQLQPSINFDTKGAFLTQGLGNGLPVVSVNINAVDINFYRVREKDRLPFLQEIAEHRYYWRIANISRFGDLVYSGRYELDIPDNTRVKRSIDIEGIQPLKAPGMYLAVMNEAGTYEEHQLMWFSVTDIGLHARFYNNQLDVYASSLKTGKALDQVAISLVNDKGEVLQQGLSSPAGQVSFIRQLDDASLIVAQSDKHFSIIEVQSPALDLSEFDLGLRPSRPQELFIYAPRDLYRPGEFIDFNALLRDTDGRLPANSVLTAAIKSPDGTTVKSFRWDGNPQHYYHYQWQIPASAKLGDWQLDVSGIDKKSFTFKFKVEEFLPERLKLTFNPDHPQRRPVATAAKPIAIPVLGEYLYGAPASGNKLTTDVITSLWRRPVESLPAFEFGDVRQTQFNTRAQLKDIQLDPQGRSTLSHQGDWPGLQSPLRVKFVSSLYESGGRPVSRAYSALIWPSDYMLGIRSSFGDDNPAANSRVSFDIVKSSLDGIQQAANDLDVKLIREDRRYFWVYSQAEGWHYQWSDNEYVELSTQVDIQEGQSAQVEFPVDWGHYRLEVRDPENSLLTSTRFYAGTNWYQAWQESQSGSGAARPDIVAMALDKAAYVGGDIAKVKIIPPQAGEAVILVEGNAPLWMTRQFIPAEGATIEIPVSADWQQHNIYISAMVLQAGDTLKALTPKRALGLVHLPLQREPRKLTVAFDVPDKALPNKTLPVKVKVSTGSISTGSTNKPTQPLFVTLAAVDVGVLSITDFDTPDPFTAFFGQRRYQVDARDVYHRIIEISQADKARLRFGGDNDLSRGGQAPQSDVNIVSLFSGLVALNEQGEAEIPMVIPDFNGRLRLMALAFSQDQFGQEEAEITIASPVVTQIAMPRFIAMGDKSTIALDITNLSGEQQQLVVQFTGSGPIMPLSQSKNIMLENGDKTTLHYPIEALEISGQATLSLSVSGSQLGDNIERQWRLGLRPPYPARLVQIQQLLNPEETLILDRTVTSSLIPDTIEASLAISSRANINLQHQLANLLQYPYGCLEQTSSRIFPLLFATPAQQQQQGLKTVSGSRRLEMINKGIERLAMLQLGTGGFGLWNNQSGEEHWLTAYVGDLLLNARDMGFDVPKEMLSKTLKRLQRYLARRSHFYNERWSHDPKHYNFAYKAYAAYVLSRVNQAPLGALRTLADNRSSHARSGLSQLHLSIALTNMGDKRRGKALQDKALNNLPQDREQYLGDYGSQIRDLALMIHLLLKHDLDNNQAISLSFELARQLQQRHYLSTQERNALYFAGLSLNQFEGSPWSADMVLGNLLTSLTQTAPYRSALTSAELREQIKITSQHDKPLLTNINISGYGKTPPKQSDNGFAIRRHWLNLKGQEITVDQVNTGELLMVHLEITADQRSPDALVIDMLPAGFELENQNLEHAIALDEITIDGRSIAQWQERNPLKYQEFRDDRYVAALELHQHRVSHLFYLVRAVTPGTYKVPAPLVEDMYRPERHGIGNTTGDITIVR